MILFIGITCLFIMGIYQTILEHKHLNQLYTQLKIDNVKYSSYNDGYKEGFELATLYYSCCMLIENDINYCEKQNKNIIKERIN